MRSVDGGVTWSSVTSDAALVHPQIGGPNGDVWWVSISRPSYMLGQRDFIANEIAFVPASLGHVVVVGKSGLWESGDGAVNWYPMVRGLGVTVARSVAADPNSAGRAYAALADWDLLQSADGLAHVTNAPPGNASFGQSLALDTAVAPAMV